MIYFPHAKINLGLSVLSRRQDGFHDIETIFYPVAMHDALEIFPAESTSLTVTGLAIPGDPEDNLLIRAWQLVKQLRPALPGIGILLHKVIPMGAGLGGGSSDAAALLLMLNERFTLGLSVAALHELAARLGSDCAFFLQAKACIGTGRGELLEPVGLDLSGYSILLVHPGVAVSTARAYGGITPALPDTPAKELLKLSPVEWKNTMHNAFEIPVFQLYPLLAEIKAALYDQGAVYAAMSGSGSTLFGLFAPGDLPATGIPGKFRQTILPASRPFALVK